VGVGPFVEQGAVEPWVLRDAQEGDRTHRR
jgi:hypothetical protein